MAALAYNNSSSLKHGAFLVISYVVLLLLAFSSSVVNGRPATFLQDFRVTWSDSHIRQIDGGRAIQLILDQNSGFFFFFILIFPKLSLSSLAVVN